VPASFSELGGALLQVPALAVCFLNIKLFWKAHHIWSGRFGLRICALSSADQLGLNALEAFDTRTAEYFWWINAALALVSIVPAETLPDTVIFIAGAFYSVFGIILPWYRIRREKLRSALV
jgi:hypothetical protein